MNSCERIPHAQKYRPICTAESASEYIQWEPFVAGVGRLLVDVGRAQGLYLHRNIHMKNLPFSQWTTAAIAASDMYLLIGNGKPSQETK